MIETMNKLYLLIQNEGIDHVLDQLQRLGVVHIKLQKIDPEQFQDVFQTERRIKHLLKVCQTPKPTSEVAQQKLERPLNEILDEFEGLLTKVDSLLHERAKVEKDYTQLRPWGNFSHDMLMKLNSQGINFFYYSMGTAIFKKTAEKLKTLPHEIIHQDASSVYFVTIGESLDGIEPISLPATDKALCETKLADFDRQIEETKARAKSFLCYKDALNDYLLQTKDHLDATRTKNVLENHYESFSSMVGWIPANKLSEFEKGVAKLPELAYIVEKDISQEKVEDIPIQYKNNALFKLFEPITKIYATPNYREFDLTPFFAPFFVFFFGLCMCDFGYGAIVLMILSVLYFKVPKEFKGILVLGMLMSLATMFWGLIVGNYVGFEIGHHPEKHPFLAQFVVLKPEHIFYLALILGLVQIYFGMFVKVLSKLWHYGFMKALMPFGWMIMIQSITILYLQTQAKESEFKLGDMVLKFCNWVPTEYAQYSALFGVALVLLFSDLKANIFVRILKGMVHLYEVTAYLGDLLSYIRLFALGISAGILGAVLNSIALQLLNIPVPGLSHLAFGIVFVGGHIFLFFLAALGSFVHPLRLTFVEFYKNAGFAGGGIPYSPLKKSYTKNSYQK